MPIFNTTISGGGTTPTGTLQITTNGTHDVTNYANADVQVPGGVNSKFGVTVDNVFGNVTNGVLGSPQKISAITMNGVVEIDDYACLNRFYSWGSSPNGPFENGTPFSAPDLETINQGGCADMFFHCLYVNPISMPKLKTIGSSGCYEMFCLAFTGNGGFTSVDLSSVESVGVSGCYGMFFGRQSLTSVDVSGVKTIASQGFARAFQSTGITSISFNSLTSIASDAFGTGNTTYAFRSCPSLVAIHFPEAMQATIEAMTAYSNKWGATNATIYFDL